MATFGTQTESNMKLRRNFWGVGVFAGVIASFLAR
jgi:hypothetical protein